MNDRASEKTSKHISRTAWNFWVDIFTGFIFAAMVGTGILARWILPPGSRGGVGLVWLGQGKHYWGDIHFWLGVAMLALVLLHIWLHWSWVLVTWNKFIGSLRSPVTWIALIIFFALILLPLIIPRQFSQSYLDEHEKQEKQTEQIYESLTDGKQGKTN